MAPRVPRSRFDPSPEELAFLHAIVADPGNEALWLILADWLEEHDDPQRSELLRLHRQLIATCCEPDRHPGRAAWQALLLQLLTEGVRPCLPRQTIALGADLEMVFHFLPPGSFLMGSPESEKGRRDDEAQHRVTLARGFWMAVTPVTQVQWQSVMGSSPSHFQGEELPVEQVSWESCQDFCRKLGTHEEKSFRLPTEAEWEYACRAGTTTPYFFGETLSEELANYNGSFQSSQETAGLYRRWTTAVGSLPPNAWGLCDMHGNVCEWCQDCYAKDPRKAPSDAEGGKGGVARVLRGGSWNNIAKSCRAAFRPARHPAYRYRSIGFRVAFSAD
jgi:uncharacterized protein (TIGR02996 family)